MNLNFSRRTPRNHRAAALAQAGIEARYLAPPERSLVTIHNPLLGWLMWFGVRAVTFAGVVAASVLMLF